MAATLGRKPVSTGMLVLAAAMIVTITVIQVDGDRRGVCHLVPGLVVGGLGVGLAAPIAAGIVLPAVPERDAGAASGVTNTVIYADVAVIGVIFTTLLDSGFGHAASGFLWYAVAAFAVAFAPPARARAPRLTPTG